MKNLIAALVSLSLCPAAHAGYTEVQTLIAKENALRVQLSELAATHNEPASKQKLDTLIGQMREGTIKIINNLNMNQTQCEKLAAIDYKRGEKDNQYLANFGASPEQIENYTLKEAEYMEALCNAYLTQ